MRVEHSSDQCITITHWPDGLTEIKKGLNFEMKFMIRLTACVAFLWAVTFAYGQDVHYNYDRGANFQSYKTYQWVDAPSTPSKLEPPAGIPKPPGAPDLPAPPNFSGSAPTMGPGISDDQLLGQDIKRAVDEQLAQKGLKRVESGGDLQVAYQAAVREEKSVNLSAFGWRNFGYADGSVTGQTSTIPIGTLVVNIYDPARKQLIWRGDAEKTVSVKKDANKNYKQLQKAMEKLFKNYPPQAK